MEYKSQKEFRHTPDYEQKKNKILKTIRKEKFDFIVKKKKNVMCSVEFGVSLRKARSVKVFFVT